MSISPIGASNISALLLSKLMGTSSASSSGDDASSLTQSTLDSLFFSPEAQWMSRGQEGSPFKADFDKLGSLIQSGDLASAQTAYASMLEKAQPGQDATSTAFAAIGEALEAGDARSAQSAWSSVQASLASMGGEQASNPMQRDMDKLGALVSAGDLSGASSLFESIHDRFKAGDASGAGSGTSGQSSSLDTRFSTLGAALESGDAESAKSALAALEGELKKTPPPPPPGDQASSGVSDLDALLLSNYWSNPGVSSNFSSLA